MTPVPLTFIIDPPVRITLALGDLVDVNIPSPSNGNVLVYNSTLGKWVAGAGGTSGTSVVDPAAYSLARTALDTAWTGTNAGHQAYNVAVSALNTAWTGTLLANTAEADAQEADRWARDAFSIAVAGTNAANAANQLAGEAFSLAVAGTTAAHSADMWGRDAFSIAVDGTNAASSALSVATLAIQYTGTISSPTTAYTLAGEAYTLATVGTNAGNQAYTLAGEAYTLAIAGTNAAKAAFSEASTALTTAWTGTAAGNQAYQVAGEAYTLAVTGTTAAAAAQSTANTSSSYVTNATSSGTYPISLLSSGTMYYDFSKQAYQITTVDRDMFVTGTNPSAVHEIAIVLNPSSTGATHSLTYSGSITFLGSAPPSSISSKTVVVALTSLGSTLSNVIGAAQTAV